MKQLKIKKTVFLSNTIMILCIISAVYFITVVLRGRLFYMSISQYGNVPWNNRKYTEKIYRNDDSLGYSAIPNSHSQQISTYKNKPIEIFIDKNGFRIPENYQEKVNREKILFIGDSFTYGDFCQAESSFAYLAGESLEMTVINAGVQGYGLAQMLLLAKRLISSHKPRFVIVQFSEQLAIRAGCYYAPLGPRFKGFASVPFISDSGNSCKIIFPLFRSRVFDLQTEKHFNQKDKTAFLLKTCLPLYLHDDLNAILLPNIEFMLKIKHAPCKDYNKITEYVYEEIDSVCEANEADLFILAINNDTTSLKKNHLFYSKKFNLINADSALWSEYGIESQEEYYEIYGHLSQKEEVIDKHPNSLSHKIIAKSIVVKLQEFASLSH